MLRSEFLTNGSTDFEKGYSFGKGYSSASFSVVYDSIHFRSLTPKFGSSESAVVYTLRKWLISILSKSTELATHLACTESLPMSVSCIPARDIFVSEVLQVTFYFGPENVKFAPPQKKKLSPTIILHDVTI